MVADVRMNCFFLLYDDLILASKAGDICAQSNFHWLLAKTFIIIIVLETSALTFFCEAS